MNGSINGATELSSKTTPPPENAQVGNLPIKMECESEVKTQSGQTKYECEQE